MNIRYLSQCFFGILISHNIHAADLVITVENIQSPHGTINIALYTESGNFPDPSTKTQGLIVPATQGLVRGKFTNLPEKKYAIAVYQDENNNNKLDKNFFGIPKEPYGFSGNNSSISPPSFDEASSHLKGDDIHLIIRLK